MKDKVIIETMTGSEFKKYIEQKNPNGQIDTLPEVLKALEGMRDDETVKEYIERMTYEAHLSPEDREMILRLKEDIESGNFGLSDEDRQAIDEIKEFLENAEEVSEEDIEEGWQEALENAGLSL